MMSWTRPSSSPVGGLRRSPALYWNFRLSDPERQRAAGPSRGLEDGTEPGRSRSCEIAPPPSSGRLRRSKLIPAGAELVIEVHHTLIGVPRTDRSSVGLTLA